MGTPPPPPPPDIPALEETAASKNGKMLTTRERMEMHRANPTCNACHRFMDPIGLALDNFDVTAKWRTRENGMPIRLSRGANGIFPAALLRYYAGLIGDATDEEIRPSMIGHTIVRREPVGLTATRAGLSRTLTLLGRQIRRRLNNRTPKYSETAPAGR